MPRRRPHGFSERLTTAIESMIPGTLGGRVSSASPAIQTGWRAANRGDVGVVAATSAVPRPAKDTAVATSGQTLFALTYLPIENSSFSSVLVMKAGSGLTEGVDYTVDYTTGIVTLTSGATAGNRVTIQYWTTGVTPFTEIIPGDVLVFDSFDRANNASSLGATETGQIWVAEAGTWGITSNHAYKVTASAQGYATVETGVADNIDLSVTFQASTATGGGITFRSNGVDKEWFVEALASPAQLYLHDVGTLGPWYTLPANYTAGDTLKIELRGTTFNFFKNGSANGSYSAVGGGGDSSQLQTMTKHGLRDYGGGARFDDFQIVAA